MHERRADPLLGHDPPRSCFLRRGGVDLGHEPEEERLRLDRALELVELGESLVVERELRVGREKIGCVVPERCARVPVLDEVAAGSGEGEPSDQARHVGDPVHPIARLRG